MDRLVIFDTTLRDGEQAAGGALNISEKLEIARQLERLGVDVIEAGFPFSSPGDFKAVNLIAQELRKPVICALARAHPDDIDSAWEAVKGAKHPRLHVFLSASDIHLMYQLKKSREQVLEMAREMVTRAKKYTDDAEFSPMDASRTEPEYIYQILEAVIDAGATTVNIPDTVGYAIPSEFGSLIEGIFQNVSNIDADMVQVTISTRIIGGGAEPPDTPPDQITVILGGNNQAVTITGSSGLPFWALAANNTLELRYEYGGSNSCAIFQVTLLFFKNFNPLFGDIYTAEVWIGSGASTSMTITTQ